MHMICLTLFERKELFDAIKLCIEQHSDGDYLDAVEKLVQNYYDKKIEYYLPVKRDGKRYIDLPDENNIITTVPVRLNGRQSKTICLSDEISIRIRLRRVRCDLLSRCDTVYLSILVPRRKLLLKDIAEILLFDSPWDAVAAHKNTLFTPWIIHDLWKKWQNDWSTKVRDILKKIPDTAEAFHKAARKHIVHIHRQLFQASGACYTSQSG